MLPSPRTLKYFQALNREGDNFDYEVWLRRVREEEARERGKPSTTSPVDQVADRKSNAVRDGSGIGQVPRCIVEPQKRSRERLSKQHAKQTQNAGSKSIRARLFKVCDVWDNILEDRSRNAIYSYLKAVYSLVTNCQREGRAGKLLQTAMKAADLAESENPELFATIIRSTCDGKLDPKSVSKLSRALRYAAYRERPPRMLKSFIKALGGINAAADRYAKRLGRGGKGKRVDRIGLLGRTQMRLYHQSTLITNL